MTSKTWRDTDPPGLELPTPAVDNLMQLLALRLSYFKLWIKNTIGNGKKECKFPVSK